MRERHYVVILEGNNILPSHMYVLVRWNLVKACLVSPARGEDRVRLRLLGKVWVSPHQVLTSYPFHKV